MITILQFAFFSPLLMAVLAIILVMIAKLAALEKPSGVFLLSRSFAYAFVGVATSLVITIAWMIWYENTTGFGAGNAPLGWAFVYGPASAALGQFAALIHWWFKSE